MGHGKSQPGSENIKQSQCVVTAPHPFHLAPLLQTLPCLATILDVLAVAKMQPACLMPAKHLNDKTTPIRDLPSEQRAQLALPPAAVFRLPFVRLSASEGAWKQTDGSLTVERGEGMTF